LGIVCGEKSIFATEIAVATALLLLAQIVLMVVKRVKENGGSNKRETESFSLALFTVLFSIIRMLFPSQLAHPEL
jgi:hypothetical protein